MQSRLIPSCHHPLSLCNITPGKLGIGFLQLGKDLLLRELFHTPASTSTEESNLCLRQENKVGGHASTGCNALGLNRTLRLGDPFRVAKGGDHFVPIVQDGKTSVLIRAKGHLALQPINRRSNVCDCMHIG